ncbi:MAG: Smr/MutS family protein [Thermodesulfovibrionales bacterium]
MMKSACTLTSLKELKGALERKGYAAVRRSNEARTKTDEDIFLEAMADVREIREFREIPPASPSCIAPRSVRIDDGRDVLRQIVNGEKRIKLSDTGEYMEWSRSHVRKDITKRLHEGSFSVQDYIDLHGMTRNEAEKELTRFFSEAVKKRLFCIKVIHGRGLRSPQGPVLKEAFKGWLHGSFRKWVLAYATAKDCDGGLGATYILLKAR